MRLIPILILILAVLAVSCTGLPENTHIHVSGNGQTSAGDCPYGCTRVANYYWAPLHEIVLAPNQGQLTIVHEYCHAHQHWSINGGAYLAPSGIDLHDWYNTNEGIGFGWITYGLPWPWHNSAVNPIEDFAWTCSYRYTNPLYLYYISPARYNWAIANLS